MEVKLESESVLPYESQLFFFHGIGLLLATSNDKKLQQDTLKVPIIHIAASMSCPELSKFLIEHCISILGASGRDTEREQLQPCCIPTTITDQFPRTNHRSYHVSEQWWVHTSISLI